MTYRTTVYLDTSFYVFLQRADADLASATIAQLQSLGVRRVESPELYMELEVSPNMEGKRALVKRLGLWMIPPLQIRGIDFAWLAAEQRPSEVDELRSAKRQMARAHAFAASATQPLPKEDMPLMERAIQRETGVEFTYNDPDTIKQMIKPMLDQLNNVKEVVPEMAPIIEEIRVLYERFEGGEIDQAEFAAVAARLPMRMKEIAEEVIPGNRRDSAILTGILTGNDRARDIVLGRASEKAESRHLSTIADLEHLSVFLQNSETIDLLMMDGPQLATLDQRSKSEVKNIRDRIFTAADLAGVVDSIRSLTSSEDNG